MKSTKSSRKAAKMNKMSQSVPPGHPLYGVSDDYGGSMSPGAEHDLSVSMNGSMEPEEYEGEVDDEEERMMREEEEQAGISHYSGAGQPQARLDMPVNPDHAFLPPIPVSMIGSSSSSSHHLNPAATSSSSVSPQQQASSSSEFIPAPPPHATKPLTAKQQKSAKKKADKLAAQQREAEAVAAAAKALDVDIDDIDQSMIDPSLTLGMDDDDPSIPEEQAAAVAALVEGFISPHIKAENLE